VVFRAFLSHLHKSPEVNEYFYKIFADAAANPQFAVYPGGMPSVTRLERLSRGTDAFIGIYPFPDDAVTPIDRLTCESRYFRLSIQSIRDAVKGE
jgi:hypothetical protein